MAVPKSFQCIEISIFERRGADKKYRYSYLSTLQLNRVFNSKPNIKQNKISIIKHFHFRACRHKNIYIQLLFELSHTYRYLEDFMMKNDDDFINPITYITVRQKEKCSLFV